MNSQKSVSISEQEINSLPGPSVKPENSQIETIKPCVKKLTPKALQFKSEEFKKKFEKEIKLTDTAIRNLRLTLIISEVGEEIRAVSVLANKGLGNVKGVLEELQSLVKESEYKVLEGKYLELQNSFDKALEKAQAAMERLTAKAEGNLSIKSRGSDASTCSRSSRSTKTSLLKRIEKLEQALKAQSDLQGRSKQIEELEAGENACDISLPPTETEMERQSRILSALEGPSQERLVNNPTPGRRIIESSHYQPSQAPNFPSAFCRIPDVKIEPFSGNVVEFPAWEIAFNALIESQLTSIELKINLLSQHLIGEAKSLVLGLLSNHTESSYQAARNRLKQRYGNPTIISQAFLDKLHKWPIIKSHQAEELLKFSDLLVQISEIKKNVSGLGILDFPQETKIILSKLPTYIENEWRNSVCMWRELHNSYSYPPFEYFVQFIERRATRANIPELQNIVRSSGAVKPTNTRRDSKGAMTLTTSISDKSLICTYCSKNHDINNCVEFSRLSRETCMNFLQDRRLCFACGSTSEHYSRICNNRSKCKICGKWHLTALHIYNNDVVTYRS